MSISFAKKKIRKFFIPALLFVAMSPNTGVAVASGLEKEFQFEDEQRFYGNPSDPLEASKAWKKYYENRLNDVKRKGKERAIQSTKSKMILERYRRSLKENFRSSIGEFPPKSEMAISNYSVLNKTDYDIEKFTYESRPGILVTANLYVPKGGQPPYPAVVRLMGHEGGKASPEGHQRFLSRFAKSGFMVLTIDPMGQGERVLHANQFSDIPLNSFEKEGSFAHEFLTLKARLKGESLMNVFVWDVIRAIDVLEKDSRADISNLVLVGNSGGGVLTGSVLALEPRVKIAIPICGTFISKGTTCGENLLDRGNSYGIGTFEKYTVRELKGLFFILCDNFGMDVVRDIEEFLDVSEAKTIFKYANSPNSEEEDLPSTLALEWLKKSFNLVREDIHGGYELVHRRFLDVVGGNVGIADKPVEEAFGSRGSYRSGNIPINDREDLKKAILEAVRSREGEYPKLELKETRPFVEQGLVFSNKKLTFKGKFPIPFVEVTPEHYKGRLPSVVMLHEFGKMNGLTHASHIASKGYRVILANVGSMSDVKIDYSLIEKAKIDKSLYRDILTGFLEKDSQTIDALWNGTTSFGDRMEELKALLRHVRAQYGDDGNDVSFVGFGDTGLLGLHAATFSPFLEKVINVNTITSFEELVTNPNSLQNPYIYIPDVLNKYTLKELYKSGPYGKTYLINPIKSDRTPLEPFGLKFLGGIGKDRLEINLVKKGEVIEKVVEILGFEKKKVDDEYLKRTAVPLFDGGIGFVSDIVKYGGKYYAGTGYNGDVLTAIEGTDRWNIDIRTKESYANTLAVFKNKLYVGTYPLGKLFVYNGDEEREVYQFGGTFKLISYKESLFALGESLYASSNGVDWREVRKSAYRNGIVWGDRLYLSQGNRIVKTSDGINYEEVGEIDKGDVVWAFEIFNNKLFFSTLGGTIYFADEKNRFIKSIEFNDYRWLPPQASKHSTLYGLKGYGGSLYATGLIGKLLRYDGKSWESYALVDKEGKPLSNQMGSLSVVDNNLFLAMRADQSIYKIMLPQKVND